MKRAWFESLTLLTLLVIMATPALAANPVEGELVDSRCYLNMGKKGADHQMCAQACAKGGLPLGILTSKGKYYTLVVQPQDLADHAGLQARVEGKVDNKTNTITPMKLEVQQKNGEWQEVSLPKHMM